MLDIGIVIPELAKYGGAERLLIECVARWQHRHQLTLYSTYFNEDLLREHGVTGQVRRVPISPYFDGDHAFVLNGTLLPKIWENEIGEHQLYHAHLWPTHLIDRRPMVWYPHEPPRMLQDLRHSQPVEETDANKRWRVHCYPKFTYDDLPDSTYHAAMSTVTLFDQLGNPDRIVANSRFTAGCLEEVYGRPVADVVYPGVNAADFVTLPATDNLFLTVGQLWPHKRIKLILEATALVPNARLCVVGDGPERDNLQRMAQTLNIADRVEFLSGLANRQLQDLYARCAAFVFAAVNEPFGIVALEAMAAGKPIVCAGEGGYREVVDESCAFAVPPQPASIAEKMQTLLADPSLAERMGLEGRRRVEAYSWDRTATELGQILEESYRRHEEQHRRRVREAYGDLQLPLVGIQFYCWYGEGAGSAHWNDNPRFGGVTDMPSIGYYSSSDGTAIRQQLTSLERAGVDFAILNLHVDAGGPNDYELVSIKRILSVARQMNTRLRFTVQLCPYGCEHRQLTEATDILRPLARDPVFLRLNEKPVLFFFWNGTLDGDPAAIKLLHEQTQDFIRIACSLRMFPPQEERFKTFGLFDGFSFFSPLELGREENWERLWKQGYRDCAAGAMELRIATISPGYDDSHLIDPERELNPNRVIARNNGATYRVTMDFVLGLSERPDMVLISTFNEYHENSHVEESHEHGGLYMEMTQAFVQELRRRWPANS